MIRSAGLDPVGIPVDVDGMCVEQLAEQNVGAVLVTPAHQCPTGHPMAPTRRAALLAWARSTGGYVLEDDYDAEYRYDREPIGTLQGLDPERVVYIGSASKILAPGLRLGWMLCPAALTDELTTAKGLADAGSPVLDQLTLAHFVSDGHLERHLRRMRSHYRARHRALLAALHRWLPDGEIEGIPAGLYVTTRLPEGTDERALLLAARARGVVAYGRTWCAVDGDDALPGLVLGYGNLPEAKITWGIQQIAHALHDIER